MDKNPRFNMEGLLLVLLLSASLIIGCRGIKEGRMNFAGKSLAENLNLMSSVGTFSGSRRTRNLCCSFLGLP